MQLQLNRGSVHRQSNGARLHSCFRTTGLIALMLLVLASSASAQEPPENPFPGRFPAPDLEGGTEWLNCSGPISLRDLRGKIVLLDFWTYCCINCMHVLPDLKYLEQKYADQLVVIGVHSAKFDNEKESENIREAIMRYEIEHPVVNDANMVIARNYAFNSWPTFILIDPEGNFVGRQPGEGNRELFDGVIAKMVEYHRAKGTLDETPVRFNLERQQAEPTPLRYPGKILADERRQRLFISDSNHNRIVITTLEGELLDIIGTGQVGATDGGYAAATFDHPQGMELVGNTLYVADTENHLLREVDLESKQVKTLAGTGVQSRVRVRGGDLKSTALNSPWALHHHDGVLYIAMAGPHQMWRHAIGSNSLQLYAGTGREDITDGTLDTCALAQPSGITSDGTAMYIVDSEGSAVRKIDYPPKESVTTVVGPHDFPRGRSLFEFGDIDGAGDEVRLQHPIGLVHHAGKLYVADTYNDKIKEVDLKTRETKTWLGTGERGSALTPDVLLAEPAGLSVAAGKLFIADTNNHRILATDLATKQTVELKIAGLTPPSPKTDYTEPAYDGPTEQLTRTTLAAGKPVTVTVQFDLPEGYKLNELAPTVYKVTVNGDVPFVPADQLNQRQRAEKQQTSATFNIPLTNSTGNGELVITVSYQFCRDGVGGLCRFATKQWTIPVTTAQSGASELKLSAKPE